MRHISFLALYYILVLCNNTSREAIFLCLSSAVPSRSICPHTSPLRVSDLESTPASSPFVYRVFGTGRYYCLNDPFIISSFEPFSLIPPDRSGFRYAGPETQIRFPASGYIISLHIQKETSSPKSRKIFEI